MSQAVGKVPQLTVGSGFTVSTAVPDTALLHGPLVAETREKVVVAVKLPVPTLPLPKASRFTVGPAPPSMLSTTEPFAGPVTFTVALSPVQMAGTERPMVAAKAGGSFTVAFALATQPPSVVTTTLYAPAGTPVIFCVVAPLLHEKLNTGVPPVTVRATAPSLPPKHEASVGVAVSAGATHGSPTWKSLNAVIPVDWMDVAVGDAVAVNAQFGSSNLLTAKMAVLAPASTSLASQVKVAFAVVKPIPALLNDQCRSTLRFGLIRELFTCG